MARSLGPGKLAHVSRLPASEDTPTAQTPTQVVNTIGTVAGSGLIYMTRKGGDHGQTNMRHVRSVRALHRKDD